jgi:hypothetical protein
VEAAEERRMHNKEGGLRAAEAAVNFPSSVEGVHPKIQGYFSNLRTRLPRFIFKR